MRVKATLSIAAMAAALALGAVAQTRSTTTEAQNHSVVTPETPQQAAREAARGNKNAAHIDTRAPCHMIGSNVATGPSCGEFVTSQPLRAAVTSARASRSSWTTVNAGRYMTGILPTLCRLCPRTLEWHE